jgi:hypothetical protein
MGNVTLYGLIGIRIMVADSTGKLGVVFKEIMQKLSIMPWFFFGTKIAFQSYCHFEGKITQNQ